MKKFLKYVFCLVAAFSLIACAEDKPSIINLSTKTLTFQSFKAQQPVFSNGGGFILDAIVQDGKDVSVRGDQNGDLLLEGDWLTVVTPGVTGGYLAKKMVVTVKANNTGSDRECQILVHNGNVKEKVLVTQKKEETDKEK